MATFRKRNDKWQARVQRSGQSPISKTFNTKADAVKWARNIESQLDLGTFAPKQTMPRLMPLMLRYVEEVTPTKKGDLQERYRPHCGWLCHPDHELGPTFDTGAAWSLLLHGGGNDSCRLERPISRPRIGQVYR